jgi:two-component system cell cycle sensor histidine kinase/response regulator CckA
MMRSPTILIVEDEAVVRNVMVTVLVHGDYRVFEADSAAEALEVSNTYEGVIDLLVADHTLKTMTGRQLAEKICQTRPGLRVLQISGYAQKKLEEGEAKAGADFLEKPFSPKALLEKVREILNRPRAQTSP